MTHPNTLTHHPANLPATGTPVREGETWGLSYQALRALALAHRTGFRALENIRDMGQSLDYAALSTDERRREEFEDWAGKQAEWAYINAAQAAHFAHRAEEGK